MRQNEVEITPEISLLTMVSVMFYLCLVGNFSAKALKNVCHDYLLELSKPKAINNMGPLYNRIAHTIFQLILLRLFSVATLLKCRYSEKAPNI